MKIKSKKVLIDIPCFQLFDDYHEASIFAQAINEVLHGKEKVKYEEIGMMGSKYVVLFYFHHDKEFIEFRKYLRENVIDNDEKNV